MVEDIFELRLTRKSRCFDTRNSCSDSDVNSRKIISSFLKNWSWKPVRVFDISSEMRNDSTGCFAFVNVMHEFSKLRHSIQKKPRLDWRLLKQLTRQSKIHKLINNQYIQCFQCFRLAKIVRILRFGSQKVFPFFHSNFHLNLLRCRCRNTKRFLALTVAFAK